MIALWLWAACAARVPAGPAPVDVAAPSPPPRPARIALDVGAPELVFCWDGREAGPCTERCEGCAEPATIVGVAPLGEGPVEVPVHVGEVAWGGRDPCESWSVSADQALPWGHDQATGPAPEDLSAVLQELGEGAALGSAVTVPLEVGPVVVFEASTPTGGVVGAVVDGAIAWIADDRLEPPDEDLTEQERFERETERATTALLGVTDLDLDGGLDLVLQGEGFEWRAVRVVGIADGGVVERARWGCAI